MKIPWYLWCIICILLVFCILLFVQSKFICVTLPEEINEIAVLLTLIAVIIYVYYTYILAKDTWTPSASFLLKPYPQAPYHFLFLIQNHSKLPLNCCCKLNARVMGQQVELGKFYSGESSFDLQPFGAAHGHFDIKDIINKANKTLAEMKKLALTCDIKEPLYLDIEFWYNPIGTKKVTQNPKQPHYFDFKRDILVMDF